MLSIDNPNMNKIGECINSHVEILLEEARKEDAPQRFMNVDLIDFLGQISKQVIIHYPCDWDVDVKTLKEYANSPNLEEKKLAWHVSDYGTHILPEREVFIKDTWAYNYWVNYRPNDPSMIGYFIEITGCEGDKVIGNVYEVGNYAEHVQYIQDISMPFNSVTLNYIPDWGINAGKSITVSRQEYYDESHRLMGESGKVDSLRYHTADDLDLAELINQERAKRRYLSVGIPKYHLKKLSYKLSEIRNIPKEQPETDEPKIAKPIKRPTFDEIVRAAQQRADKNNENNNIGVMNYMAKLDVRVYPSNDKNNSTKAFASITVEDLIAIKGIRVIEGPKGPFVSMPQSKDTKGDYHDIAFPITSDLRAAMNKVILDEYRETTKMAEKAAVQAPKTGSGTLQKSVDDGPDFD